jgi:L-asparaginase
VPEATVRVVKSGLGVTGESLREAVDAEADGIVLEGTGLGNATAALGDAVDEAVGAGVPVVVTSRCQGGATAPVYGTGGGGETLSRHGAIFADDLPAHKARLKLALALEASDGGAVAERFGSDR